MIDWKNSDDPESYQRRIRSGFYPDEWFPISHSQLEVYEICPRRYKYENVDRLGRESGVAAELGNDLHNIQQEIAELGIEGARDFVSAMVPLTKSREWKKLKAALDQISLKQDYLYATERRFHWTWPIVRERDSRTLKVQFEAKIDILFFNPFEQWLEIIDGKSSEDVLPNIDHDPQGLTYAVVALSDPELGSLGIGEVIFTQAQWAKGRLVSTVISDDERINWQRLLEEKTKRIANDTEYRPQTGVHCMWCPFALRCDAAQKKLPELVEIAGHELPVFIQSYEDAIRIGEGAAHLRAIYLRYEKALAGYLKFAERSGSGRARLELPSGSYIFETTDGRKPAGGIDGLLERHPDEKEGLTGSYYSRLTLKRKDK